MLIASLMTLSVASARPRETNLVKEGKISILYSFPATAPMRAVEGRLIVSFTTKFFQAGRVFESESELDASLPSCAIEFEPFDISRTARGKFITPIQNYKIVSSKVLETRPLPVLEFELAYVDHVMQITTTQTKLSCKTAEVVFMDGDPFISIETVKTIFGENAKIAAYSLDREARQLARNRYQCRYYFQINHFSLPQKGHRYRIRLNGSAASFNATGFQNEPRFIFGEMPLDTSGRGAFLDQINLSLDEEGFLGSYRPLFRGRVDMSRKDGIRVPGYDSLKMENGAILSLKSRYWQEVSAHDFMAYDSSLGATNDRIEFNSGIYSGSLFRSCELSH